MRLVQIEDARRWGNAPAPVQRQTRRFLCAPEKKRRRISSLFSSLLP